MHTKEDLIEAIYPALLTYYSDMSWLSKQCILAPLNETICLLNAKACGIATRTMYEL